MPFTADFRTFSLNSKLLVFALNVLIGRQTPSPNMLGHYLAISWATHRAEIIVQSVCKNEARADLVWIGKSLIFKS